MMLRILFYIALLLPLIGHAQQQTFVQDTFDRRPIPVLVEQIQFAEGVPVELARKIEQYAYGQMEDHWRFVIVNSDSAPVSDTIAPEYIVQLNFEPLIDAVSSDDVRDSTKQVVRTNYRISVGIKVNLRVTTITTGELAYSKEVLSTQFVSGRKLYEQGVFQFVNGRFTGVGVQIPRSYPIPQSPAAEAELLEQQKSTMFSRAYDEWLEEWDKTLLRIFPMRIHITEVLERKGKKAQWVTIDAGEDFSLTKNTFLLAYTQRNYEAMGTTFVYTEDLGYLVAKEVGPNSSRVKVTYRSKDITAALDSGATVFCRLAGEEP